MRREQSSLPARREPERWLTPWDESGFFGQSWFGGSPWRMMRRMQEDMDHLFEQFFGAEQGGGAGFGALQRWTPGVDISQTDGEWCIEADLPGVDRDDINVEVRDRHLILRAEMRQETPETREDGKERQYLRRERRYGYFERVIPLPQDVDEGRVRCEFRNGVLVIHVPKTEQAKPQARRIPVAGGETTAIGGGKAGAAAGTQGASRNMTVGETEEEEEREFAGAKGGERRGQEKKGQ